MSIPALYQIAHKSVLDLSKQANPSNEEDLKAMLGCDSALTVLKLLNAYKKEPSPELLDICNKRLSLLIRLQGNEVNLKSGEEPGKFIRFFAKAESLPENNPWFIYNDGYTRMYDSIDATPLTLISIYKYWQITSDNEFLLQSLSSVEKALNWIITYGDKDKDALLEHEYQPYAKDEEALYSWTDAHRLLLAESETTNYPIAPVETQAFAWLALRLWSDFYRDHYPTFGHKIYTHAAQLKQQFNKLFLLEDRGYWYTAQALDGNKEQIKRITANPLFCLWASYKEDGKQKEAIIEEEIIASMVERAFLPDMFDADAGIRLLSSDTVTGNLRFHGTKSFWPVVNGYIIEGLEKYKFWKQASALTEASLKPIAHFQSPVESYIKSEHGYESVELPTSIKDLHVEKVNSAAAVLDMVTIPRWARKAVVYQIYPRSFKDTNKDGIGDLQGIIEKLDYLQYLGINAIWLSPIYKSPMADNGYDIADYCDIDPIFGSLSDFDRLIEGAHKRNIKVMLDFVPNHTSNQHRWFKESASSKVNPKRDWYIWKDPKEDGSTPNNWISVSGGSAWQFDQNSGQYYLHSFLPEQPDLNWRNPEVVEAMCNVLRFWMDKGVDGFRVDVIYYLIKDNRFIDEPLNENYRPGTDHPNEYLKHIYSKDQPETLEIIRTFCDVLDEYPNKFMVSETYVDIPETVRLYTTSEKGLHAPFNFHLLYQPWEAEAYKNVVDTFQSSLRMQDLPVYILGNHDQSRVATRVGGQKQARIAAMMQLTLPGMPFIYYGDEIGMEDVNIPFEKRADKFETCRDFERTPFQWNSNKYAGFSDVEPWLPTQEDFQIQNAEKQQEDPTSMLSLYRFLIQFRKNTSALTHGKYLQLNIKNEHIFAYKRKYGKSEVTVILNYSGEDQNVHIDNKNRKAVCSTYMDEREANPEGYITLRPFEGIILV